MKKIFAAVILGLWLLFAIGCSSIPSGTDKIADLNKNAAAMIGKNVVVVGLSETKTTLSSFRMFKISQGNDWFWVKYPQDSEEPPQGIQVRVTGTVQESQFNIIGKAYFIQATKVAME
ncbi:MAG TPA: hypothetical protein VMG30_03370 [Acidobacteriota bacterium]|nr:hypothetical protein [Acidobacteriota bacterium]